MVRARLRDVLLTCALLWSDFFLVDDPLRTLYREVKVELCTRAQEPRIIVSGRLYREAHTATGLEQIEVQGWRELKEWRLEVARGAELTK